MFIQFINQNPNQFDMKNNKWRNSEEQVNNTNKEKMLLFDRNGFWWLIIFSYKF